MEGVIPVFNKKFGFMMLSLVIAIMLVLSGCSDKKLSPKDALQASLTKSSDIQSYKFQGKVNIEDFNFPQEGQTASETTAVLNMLKNAELSWTGTYRADPMMMEMNLQLALKGDMAITFNVPIVMTSEKVWVKIPNIPMLPIPENIVGKFVELDLKQLAEQSGQTMPTIDVGKSQKLMNDIMAIVFKNVDENTYLSDVKVKDAALPEGVNVDHVVRFHLDQAQVEPFVNTVIDKIAPEVIDLLSSNQEYRDMLQIKPEDLDAAKKALSDAKNGDVAKSIDDMKKGLKSLDITANIGIDKKEFPIYTDATVQASIESPETTGSFKVKVVSQISNVNEEAKFEIGQPKADEIITMDELQQQFGGMLGGGLSGTGSTAGGL
jgi:hypothetical protein